MSLALIEESAKEVRRLAIAGSPLAVGDFRLKKLIGPLEQAGAKVPVFAQVAKAISDLVIGAEADSATRLLNLSTLLNAILYTQGSSGVEGTYLPLEVSTANCKSTRISARTLKPLLQAFTGSGGGRFELIKTAVENGSFNDLRVIGPAIQALGDNYPGLADLVTEKIMPHFGPGIIPQLRVSFDPKGKKHDARKLAVMHQLHPAGTIELCKSVLEDGSPDVKITAIACLGKHEDCVPIVLEQSNSKNREIRAAALKALAAYDRPDVTRLFAELIKGKALDMLAGPFRVLRNRHVLHSMLEEGRKTLESILKGESEQIQRFLEILKCLGPRRETEVEVFLLDAFAQTERLAKVKAAQNSTMAGVDLTDWLVQDLYRTGSPKSLAAILEKRHALPATVFPLVFRSGLRTWPAEKVFAEFSPLLKEKAAKEHLERFVHGTYARRELSSEKGDFIEDQLMPDKLAWDVRWLDAAIKADSRPLVCWLAQPNHKASWDYLSKLDDAKEPYYASLTVRALARCQYPKVTDFFLDHVAKKSKGAKYLDYELQTLLGAAQYLPKSDLPQLEAFAAKLDEKFVDHFLTAIAPLRPVSQP